MPNSDTSGPMIKEPLKDLADFAFEQAPDLCDPAIGCQGYHRFWSMLRLVQLDGKLPRGAGFFGPQLRRVANEKGQVRVLLAGSADTGLTCLIASQALEEGLEPSLIVVDRCATPLALNRRFADAEGLILETYQGQLQALEGLGVDAVITHNMMGFNDDDGRADILRAIGRTLRPGGRLVSIERLADTRQEKSAQDRANLLAMFEASLRKRGTNAENFAHLSAAAKVFWETNLNAGAYPESRYRAHVAAAGLSVVDLTYRRDTSLASPRANVDMSKGLAYAYTVVERPS